MQLLYKQTIIGYVQVKKAGLLKRIEREREREKNVIPYRIFMLEWGYNRLVNDHQHVD